MSRPNTEFRSARRKTMVMIRKENRSVARRQAIKDRGTREFVPWTWVRATERKWAKKS